MLVKLASLLTCVNILLDAIIWDKTTQAVYNTSQASIWLRDTGRMVVSLKPTSTTSADCRPMVNKHTKWLGTNVAHGTWRELFCKTNTWHKLITQFAQQLNFWLGSNLCLLITPPHNAAFQSICIRKLFKINVLPLTLVTINTTYTEMIEEHPCKSVSEVCRAQNGLYHHHPILFRVHHQVPG